MLYPLPTSSSGVIATLIKYSSKTKDYLNLSAQEINWVSEFLEILGEKYVLRGPFIMMNNDFYLLNDLRKKFLLQIHFPLFIKLDDREYNKIHGDLVVDLEEKLEDIFEDRIGIELERGSKKVVDGSLYTAKFLNIEKLSEEADYTLSYYYEANGIDNRSLHVNELTIKFGGETRIAKLSVKNIETSVFDKYFNLSEEEEIGLYVVSPLLIETGMSREELIEYMINQLENITGNNVSDIDIFGESTIISAGFASKLNNKKHARRPIYEALKPGSKIKVRFSSSIDEDNIKKIYWNGLGTASKLGFGTIFPFKIMR